MKGSIRRFREMVFEHLGALGAEVDFWGRRDELQLWEDFFSAMRALGEANLEPFERVVNAMEAILDRRMGERRMHWRIAVVPYPVPVAHGCTDDLVPVKLTVRELVRDMGGNLRYLRIEPDETARRLKTAGIE